MNCPHSSELSLPCIIPPLTSTRGVNDFSSPTPRDHHEKCSQISKFSSKISNYSQQFMIRMEEPVSGPGSLLVSIHNGPSLPYKSWITRQLSLEKSLNSASQTLLCAVLFLLEKSLLLFVWHQQLSQICWKVTQSEVYWFSQGISYAYKRRAC